MELFLRIVTFLLFFLIAILNISCENPTGDFVINQAENWSDVLVIAVTADSDRSKLEDIKITLIDDDYTVSVTALSDIPTKSDSKVIITLMDAAESDGIEAYISFIDYGFLETLGLEIIEGRNFSNYFPSDSTTFMINKNLSQLLENQSVKANSFSPVGLELNFSYKSQKYHGYIVGVIDDYRIHVDDGKIAGSVPMIFKISAKEHRYLAVRTKDISATTTLLQNKWNEFALSTPFEIFYLSDRVPDFTKVIERNQTIKLYVIDAILTLTLIVILGGLIINRQGFIGRLFQMSGRINRSKYFFLGLMTSLVYYGLLFIIVYKQSSVRLPDTSELISVLLILGNLLVILIIQSFLVVKRLHDLDLHGSRFWLLFIPFYNVYLGLFLLFKKGTVGPNKYGEDQISTN